MNPSIFLTGFVIALILLSDPGSSSCGRCDIIVKRTGNLPDTTLSTGTTWNIVLSERFAATIDNCYYDYDYEVHNNRFTPVELNWKLEGTSISLQQQSDTLTITALAPGKTNLFLSATGNERNDPNVVNQHLTIMVK